jgi:hypothetical protein
MSAAIVTADVENKTGLFTSGIASEGVSEVVPEEH